MWCDVMWCDVMWMQCVMWCDGMCKWSEVVRKYFVLRYYVKRLMELRSLWSNDSFLNVFIACSLSFHVLLYLPLIETTLILNESLVYEWQIQQHMRRQPKVFIWNAVGNVGDRVSHMLWNVDLKCYKMFRNVTRNVVQCRNMGIQNVVKC
jgi:hypothetical protein